jgi:integrase
MVRASDRTLLRPLLRKWLLDLQVLGRSPRTLRRHEQKMQWYLESGGVATLEDLNGFELKRLLASLQADGLAENTVKGMHLTFKAFGNESYPADQALLRVRSPKVAQTEMESFSASEQQDLLRAVRPGWPRLAVQILLGTGRRVSELCALTLDDVGDDDDASFLKVRRGKGGKLRRVPISRHLQRELSRW